jgi:putative oxidoreductase
MNNTRQDIGIILLRISIASTMFIYGISKLIHGIGFIANLLTQYGLPSFLGYGVYVGEIIAPILIIIGYRTKLAGLIFATNCFVATLLVQLPNLLKLNDFGGWEMGPLFIYTLFGIALFFTGGGKYSVSTKNKWD